MSGQTPEDKANKLENSNAVDVTSGYWRNSLNQIVFQNVDDLYEYGIELGLGRGESTLVIVIDNEGEDVDFPNNKNYWVIEYISFGISNRNNTADIVPLVDYYDGMREELGRRWFKSAFGPTGSRPDGGIKVGSYKKIPIFVPDPERNDNRPEVQKSSTTSKTTNTTVETTITEKPGAAAALTTSETKSLEKDIADVDATSLDAFGGAGRPVGGSSDLDAFGGAGRQVGGNSALDAFGGAGRSVTSGYTKLDALAPVGLTTSPSTISTASTNVKSAGAKLLSAPSGKIESGTLNPCLPQDKGTGTGSVPPIDVPYPDAILRQARKAAADPLDAFGGAGAEIVKKVSDPLDAFGGIGANVTKTAPSVLTSTASTNVGIDEEQETPIPSSNVYVYEPFTGGFDRYDFNTGKKVYTTNVSKNTTTSSPQSVTSATQSSASTQTGPF